MAREPFVWEVRVKQEVLEDEVAKLRDLPYTLWTEVIASPLSREAEGRDGKPYHLKVTATWAEPGSRDIRVTVTLRSPGLRPGTVQDSFVITRENTLLD